MSEQYRIELSDKITEGIRNAQRELFERKAKLGEDVVVADSDGMPLIITAEEALRRMSSRNNPPE